MMIKAFASDLDRTLIYSKKMLEMYETLSPYELIETLDGKEISYISLKTKANLKKLNNEIYFIPVTTRTVSQYKRISIFQSEIIPEYAITSNGGTILKNGAVLEEWSSIIQEELKACSTLDDMIEEIKRNVNVHWIEQINQADNLFIYLIINRSLITVSEIDELRKWAGNLGWQMSLQGRKLYFVPFPVNKWKAVEYLCKIMNISTVCTAGDSLLDYELIKNAHLGIAPSHGEVLEHYPSLKRTNTPGMKSSEEILEMIQHKLLTPQTM